MPSVVIGAIREYESLPSEYTPNLNRVATLHGRNSFTKQYGKFFWKKKALTTFAASGAAKEMVLESIGAFG